MMPISDAEAPAGLDMTLLALAAPTRRTILRLVSDREARVTEVAKSFAISLNAVSKHIRVVERAGLVRRRKSGREHDLSVDPKPLIAALRWIESQRAAWTTRLDALDTLLKDAAGVSPGG